MFKMSNPDYLADNYVQHYDCLSAIKLYEYTTAQLPEVFVNLSVVIRLDFLA